MHYVPPDPNCRVLSVFSAPPPPLLPIIRHPPFSLENALRWVSNEDGYGACAAGVLFGGWNP